MFDGILNERLGLEIIGSQESIFHYTNVKALLNIIENKEFWITDSLFLNDSSEIVYINTLLQEVCSEFKLSDKFTRKLQSYLKEKINSNERRYILSFSTDKDSLTLWSEFSEFYGCCIEFDISELRKNFESVVGNNTNKYFVEGKVVYSKLEQNQLLKNAFERNIDDIKREYDVNELCNSSNKKVLQDLYSRLLGELKYYALFFKDESFKDENEYRIVYSDMTRKKSINELNFREKGGLIIPYIKMPLENEKDILPIKSILVGSKNNSDIAIEGIKYYLKENNYNLSKIIVSKSKITLRY